MFERSLLMDASCQGKLRLWLTENGQFPALSDIHCYPADELPTFTDALIRLERDTGTTLSGTTAALAVAGAVSGDIITIARSRWVISRSGLAPMFGQPVAILNDVAARAWATLQGVQVRERLQGLEMPALTVGGRTALLTLDEGVGAAVINVNQMGQTTVIESEAGHMDFVPTDDAEEQLCRSLRTAGEQPSWEQVLMAALAGDMTGADPARAGYLVGRFAGNAALALGAWQGVMITGRNTARLAHPAARAAFTRGFCMRHSFRRQLAGASCWVIEQREPVMLGLVALLADRRNMTDRSGADDVTSRSRSASGLQ